MVPAVARTVVTDATVAWKLLNGIVCIYKPYGWVPRRVLVEFKKKICDDLNLMKPPPRQERVELIRVDDADGDSNRIPMENEQVISSFQDGSKRIDVVKGLAYSDHPLIVGDRFHWKDIKMMTTGTTGANVSGVHLYGVNRGMRLANLIYYGKWLRTYEVSGRFGIATDTNYFTGRTIAKSTYGSIRKNMLESFLSSSESSHQRFSFMASGVPLDSERAYDLASQGLVRPATASETIIYSMKCTHFNLPDFTIGTFGYFSKSAKKIKSVNEDPWYLKRIIHDIGLKLRSVATCTKIRCTNVGPFGLNDALLLKHWTIDNVLENMKRSRDILKDFDMHERDMWVDKPLPILEPEMEDELEEKQ